MDNTLRYDCAVDATMSIIGGKWKSTILCLLTKHGKLRFSELSKKIPPISPRILSKQLHELANDGIVRREEVGTKASRVEYSLTKKGHSLGPVLKCLVRWNIEHNSEIPRSYLIKINE
ncbi:MAG TPA: helix-turn-helix domain-containing protein [Candidatus Methanomethylophilaceae archaeon]|nr:helix-turn-helix domain-containing protein [Candidatus Methanomethylophilaceae archaeon]